jgi:hypothetical protein
MVTEWRHLTLVLRMTAWIGKARGGLELTPRDVRFGPGRRLSWFKLFVVFLSPYVSNSSIALPSDAIYSWCWKRRLRTQDRKKRRECLCSWHYAAPGDFVLLSRISEKVASCCRRERANIFSPGATLFCLADWSRCSFVADAWSLSVTQQTGSSGLV